MTVKLLPLTHSSSYPHPLMRHDAARLLGYYVRFHSQQKENIRETKWLCKVIKPKPIDRSTYLDEQFSFSFLTKVKIVQSMSHERCQTGMLLPVKIDVPDLASFSFQATGWETSNCIRSSHLQKHVLASSCHLRK